MSLGVRITLKGGDLEAQIYNNHDVSPAPKEPSRTSGWSRIDVDGYDLSDDRLRKLLDQVAQAAANAAAELIYEHNQEFRLERSRHDG